VAPHQSQDRVKLGAVKLFVVELGAVKLHVVELGAVKLHVVKLGAVKLYVAELGAVKLHFVELGAFKLETQDRFYETPFRPKNFPGNFSRQILFHPKTTEMILFEYYGQ
jgi:hypothetical protein